MSEPDDIIKDMMAQLQALNAAMDALPKTIESTVSAALEKHEAKDPERLANALAEETITIINEYGGYADIVRGMSFGLEDYIYENEKELYEKYSHKDYVDWSSVLLGNGLSRAAKHDRNKLIKYACRFRRKMVQDTLHNFMEKIRNRRR